MSNLRGKYVGIDSTLKGKTALLRRCIDGGVMAQFDDLKLPREVTHGWTKFSALEFEIIKAAALPKEEAERDWSVCYPGCNCVICMPDPHSRFQ